MPHPRRAVRLGLIALALLVVGAGAGLWLTDRSQDGGAAATASTTPPSPGVQSSSSMEGLQEPTGASHAVSPSGGNGVQAAVAQAAPGDVVTLAAGEYGDLTIDRSPEGASQTNPVVVRPADGATVTVGAIDVEAPGVRFEGLRVTGTLYVHPGGEGTTLRDVHLDGAGIFVRGNGTRVLDSLIENGRDVGDGIQVKDATDVLVQGNTIRGFAQLTSELHSDCIQLFDTRQVVIRGNTLHDCDNAGIIFSPGRGEGIERVLVEANFIMGCRERWDGCGGGTAIDLRYEKARDVVVRNNTFGSGSVRIEPTPGQIVDRNVFAYVSSCETPMTNTVVGGWNEGLCDQPTLAGRQGNRVGTPRLADPGAVDLHVADGATADVTVSPVPVTHPTWAGQAVDFDGQSFSSSTAGADEPGNRPVAAPAAPTAPTGTPSAAPGAPSTPSSPATGTSPATPGAGGTPVRADRSGRDGQAGTGGAAATPQVQVLADGRPRSGVTVVQAVASPGASAVLFHVPGRQVAAKGTSADGGRTWTVEVDTRLVRNGTYPVVAVVVDAAGRSFRSAEVRLTVRN